MVNKLLPVHVCFLSFVVPSRLHKTHETCISIWAWTFGVRGVYGARILRRLAAGLWNPLVPLLTFVVAPHIHICLLFKRFILYDMCVTAVLRVLLQHVISIHVRCWFLFMALACSTSADAGCSLFGYQRNPCLLFLFS